MPSSRTGGCFCLGWGGVCVVGRHLVSAAKCAKFNRRISCPRAKGLARHGAATKNRTCYCCVVCRYASLFWFVSFLRFQDDRPFSMTRRVLKTRNPLDFFHVCPLLVHEKMCDGNGRPVHKFVFACPGKAEVLVSLLLPRAPNAPFFFSERRNSDGVTRQCRQGQRAARACAAPLTRWCFGFD